jgi:hydrogenase expression/formation protein HypC
MCLAIPGKIQRVFTTHNGRVKMAVVSFGGIFKETSLEMLPQADIGDYVLVHVGVAISRIDEAEALRTLEYLREIGEIDELVAHTQIEKPA